MCWADGSVQEQNDTAAGDSAKLSLVMYHFVRSGEAHVQVFSSEYYESSRTFFLFNIVIGANNNYVGTIELPNSCGVSWDTDVKGDLTVSALSIGVCGPLSLRENEVWVSVMQVCLQPSYGCEACSYNPPLSYAETSATRTAVTAYELAVSTVTGLGLAAS